MRSLIILLMLCTLHNVAAQNGWENCSSEEFSKAIMTMENLVVDNTAYSYETDYRFFEQLEGSTPVMQEKALLICVKGEAFYIEQFGKTIIQDKFVQIEIDPNYRTIVLREAIHDYTKQKTTADFTALNVPGIEIKKQSTSGGTIYYVQFPKGLQYVGAEIKLGGPMGIQQYILYSDETTLENDEGVPVKAQPRMEVRYLNFQQNNQVKTDRMKKVTDFLVLKDGQYMTTKEYYEYELIDLRSQPE